MASQLKLEEILHPTSNNPAITINADDTVTFGAPTTTFTNVSYSGTLTGGTGVVNIGSGQVYKDASGNVGIGIAAPTAQLHLSKGGGTLIKLGTSLNTSQIEARESGGSNLLVLSSNNNSDSMVIDYSGNVGIGTASPNVANISGTALTVNNSDQAIFEVNRAGSRAFYNYINSDGSRIAEFRNLPMTFFTNDTERGRFDSAGAFLIGTTGTFGSGAGYLNLLANATTRYGMNIKNISASNTVFAVFSNSSEVQAGAIAQTGSTTVAYVTSSDYRLKENVAPMTGALEKVAALKPVTYTWKADGSAGQGFIAHELQAVVPDCVTGEKDAVDDEGNPKYQGVDTSFLVATLVAAIQEQQALIQDLTTRLTTLEGN